MNKIKYQVNGELFGCDIHPAGSIHIATGEKCKDYDTNHFIKLKRGDGNEFALSEDYLIGIIGDIETKECYHCKNTFPLDHPFINGVCMRSYAKINKLKIRSKEDKELRIIRREYAKEMYGNSRQISDF